MITELESRLLELKELHDKVTASYTRFVAEGNFEESYTLTNSIRVIVAEIIKVKDAIETSKAANSERERSNLNQTIFKLLISELDDCDLTKSGNPLWGKYEIGAAVDKLLEEYSLTKKLTMPEMRERFTLALGHMGTDTEVTNYFSKGTPQCQ